MATANFWTMDNFSLFAKDYREDIKRCPECGAIMPSDAEECECCECDELEDECRFDELACYDDEREINARLDDINRELMFHKIELRSGYYIGVQFYVDCEYCLDVFESNDGCHCCFDCCRSVARRKYDAEVRKINRLLAKLGKEYGFEELVCTARFSNGEAWFTPVSAPRAPLYAILAG